MGNKIKKNMVSLSLIVSLHVTGNRSNFGSNLIHMRKRVMTVSINKRGKY
jgi:hypothetical protein